MKLNISKRLAIISCLSVVIVMVIVQIAVIGGYPYWHPHVVGHARPLSPTFIKSSRGESVVINSMDTFLWSEMIIQQGIKLKWIQQRIERLSSSWEKARDTVLITKSELFRSPRHVLLFPGLLSEYSGYDFARMAFRGGFLGELIQWSDLIATLHMLGHIIVIATSRQQLLQATSKGIDYDLVITDYIGMNGLHAAHLVGVYKCKVRILDSFGTEPKFGFRTNKFSADHSSNSFSAWGLESYRQLWTLYPHTPDNSFLGFVIEPPSESHPHTQRKNQAVIYGKEGHYVGEYKHYLDVIGSVVELHATMNDASSYLPANVINHGVLTQEELVMLLQQSRLFIGLGFPYEGPGPLEALANGCAFIQPTFNIPHNKYNKQFFYGKPTERKYTSQNPYLETIVGQPYAYTVDSHNDDIIKQTVINALSRNNFSSFVPMEFTQEGMLERIGKYILYQNYCKGSNIATGKRASSSNPKANSAGPVDGEETAHTCFSSKLSKLQWWMVDLSLLVQIGSITITTAFDWYDLKSLGSPTHPIKVSLLDSDRVTVMSRLFEDVRLSYSWYNINRLIKYIRVDTVRKDKGFSTLTICSVGVYGPDATTPTTWPHPSMLVTVQSNVRETCRDACVNRGMICEPEFFTLLNKRDIVENNFKCKRTIELTYNYVSFAPAVSISTVEDKKNRVSSGDCVINGNRELLGCAGQHKNYKRLCPCRTYKKGQIALPVE